MKPPLRENHTATGEQSKSRSGDETEQSPAEAFEARKKLALSSIVYIRFEGKSAQAHIPDGIDPSIPYPVQLQSPVIKIDPESITEESLLAGMLRVLAWDPANVHAATYRTYIKSIRPGLFEELIAAGIQKAESREWVIAEEIFSPRVVLNRNSPEPSINLALMHRRATRNISPIRASRRKPKKKTISHTDTTSLFWLAETFFLLHTTMPLFSSCENTIMTGSSLCSRAT